MPDEIAELRRHHEKELALLRQRIDAQLADLSVRLKGQLRQEFERQLCSLEEHFQANAEMALEKFTKDMERVRGIKNLRLRDANEKFLREALTLRLNTQQRMLESFIASCDPSRSDG